MGDIIKTSEAVAVKLDTAIERGILASQIAGKMSRALAVGAAMEEIRAALTPEVMRPVMALQGTAVGFKTDKQYPPEVVRDALIEATLAGVYPVGNEFNIIAGRAYITKEGMGRKLREIDGLTYSITPGIPTMKDGGSVVPMNVEWKYKGVSASRDLPVCVKLNSGMGADAVIGKATRKARAWLYQTITGSEVSDGEAEAEINVTPKASPFESTAKHEKQKHATPIDERPFLERFMDEAFHAGIKRDQMNHWAMSNYGAKTPEEIPSRNLSNLSRMQMADVIEAVMVANSEAAQ